MQLKAFGWTDQLQRSFDELPGVGLIPARVVQIQRGVTRVQTGFSEMEALIPARLADSEPPVVGDWVACSPVGPDILRVETVLPRRTLLTRKVAGRSTRSQSVAANIDKVLLVSGLDFDFNPRRIERLLVMVYESGAVPIIVLNKSDLHPAPESAIREVEALSPGVEVFPVSALSGQGLTELAKALAPRETVALVGSSGAGKSSLINRLFGIELQSTQAVRSSDSRGRHTTTHRQLFCHPDGFLLIDNPGIRELQLWASAEGLAQAFDDVAALALQCRFRDCRHEGEPGCAILKAVLTGQLDQERLDSYRKLEKELAYLEGRQDGRWQLEQKRKWRAIHRSMRQVKPKRG